MSRALGFLLVVYPALLAGQTTKTFTQTKIATNCDTATVFSKGTATAYKSKVTSLTVNVDSVKVRRCTLPSLLSIAASPLNVSIDTGKTQQFAVVGNYSNGSTMPVTVTWGTSGGTITSTGLYTAPSTSGTYHVTAATGQLSTAATVNVVAPLSPIVTPPPVVTAPLGKPYGPFSIYAGYTAFAAGMPGPFTSTLTASDAGGVVSQLKAARAAKLHIVLAMTGGSHSNYLTNGKFDYAKWKAKQATFFTATIKAAIDTAVRDRTLIGASVMDEPEHVSWGGVMTHALVDSMSRYVKSGFPTLPTGTVVTWTWQKTQVYGSLDFIISQYSYGNSGPILAYRDSVLASARRQKVTPALSFNVLDGGKRPADYNRALTDAAYWKSQCAWGIGTFPPNCRMSPAQVAEASTVFLSVPDACLVTMWRFDSTFFARADNLAAVKQAATHAAQQPAKSCRKPA